MNLFKFLQIHNAVPLFVMLAVFSGFAFALIYMGDDSEVTKSELNDRLQRVERTQVELRNELNEATISAQITPTSTPTPVFVPLPEPTQSNE